MYRRSQYYTLALLHKYVVKLFRTLFLKQWQFFKMPEKTDKDFQMHLGQLHQRFVLKMSWFSSVKHN